MLIFVDFETKGLTGKIIEFAACDVNGNILYHSFSAKTIADMFNDLTGDGKDNVIIFWHSFMPTYLAQFQKKIFKNLNGKFACFNEIYGFMDNFNSSRYRIDHITENLTGKMHKGNAFQDCIDLKDCYLALRKRSNIA